MNSRLQVIALTVSVLTLTSVLPSAVGLTKSANAQVPPPPGPAEPLPPPPPPAPPMDDGAPSPTDPLDTTNPDIESETLPAAATSENGQTPASPANTKNGVASPANSKALAAAREAEKEIERLNAEREARLKRMRHQPSLRGSSGLLRTHFAGSAPAGTFRFGLLTSYFAQTEFLCPQCTDSEGGPGFLKDDVSRIGAHLRLGVTPWEFIEGYVGLHSTATSNSRGEPELLQVLGDSTWGIKAFMPHEQDQLFTAGGALELQLLNGAGSVGVDNANFALRGLASMDLTNRKKEAEKIPLRVNFNLSYVFDNSGKLVDDIERERQRRITRIERYGLNINRLDRLVPAIGVEAPLDLIHPYVEWSVDIPSNRQDYRCVRNDVHPSDDCLDDLLTFSSLPSRLTIGANGYVLMDGLALNLALDIGTGATSAPFIEEIQPETPWNLYLGATYAVDTQPQIEIRKVEIPVAVPAVAQRKPQYFVQGVVVEKDAPETAVPEPIIHFEGKSLTGMVGDAQGRFRTAALEPGSYTFAISAEHYEDGTCTVSVGAEPPASAEPSATAGPSASAEQQDRVIEVRCELKAEPRVGTIDGYVTDGVSSEPLGQANITVTDAQDRKLTMTTDDQGMFVVTNVPPGKIRVSAEADQHFRATSVVEVQAFKTAQVQVPLFAKPQRARVKKVANRIQLSESIDFRPGTAELTPRSLGVLDELAALLRSQDDVTRVEIGSHTGGAGSAEVNLELSTERANAIRNALINNGVPAGTLVAKGYGDSKPRGTKSERVELKLLR